MRIIALSLLLVLLGASNAKADTIDYWHVYYNQKKIKELTMAGEIVIKRNSVKPGDVITVKYFTDTPCIDCAIYVTAEDGKHHVLAQGQNKGTGEPVSIPVEELVKHMPKTGNNTIELYYYEGEIKSPDQKTFICTILLE